MTSLSPTKPWLWGLSHLYMTVFLHNFSMFMVIPAITDVTMSALCPGEDECSLAIYLTGIQQAMMGLGTLVMMPLIGNLSDTYGRKALLTLPMTLAVIPLGVLAYSRTRNFFYGYYVIRTLIAMICEGSINCLALAYVADNVPDNRRAPVFGMLSGIGSTAFVCGNLSTRFLTISSTFQVATIVAMMGVVYMRIFLPESAKDVGFSTDKEEQCLLKKGTSKKNSKMMKTLPSLDDTLTLLKSSLTFSQAAVVAFFINIGDVGLHASLMYYLKACFHFNKNQFADLMVIAGVAGTIAQMLLMPVLVPAIGEERLLSVGLFFGFLHIFLYSVAWSAWVPYVAAMFSVLAVFSTPCLRSIASKQVGPSEQGKAQGCISGICSFANVLSPLVFSPLTAIFLSTNAPFKFPGFSVMCVGFAMMVAFFQSLLIRASPPIPISINKVNNECSGNA
ncbi:hippocampus abundant transcript 1 protein [Impatiens glandulifera]|uniref:hippocampus abundant transcript 1 protein n=1 Tax=Impatiens glandulifera TaxID=253017 RepID=UPI001FB07C5C|nr:hippocampus abundant transcript 1 protein [Impatiens glandulifera]